MSRPTCRFPEKYRHASKAAALAQIESLEAAGKGSPDMSAYPCTAADGTRHWHVGHDLRKFRQRIRDSIRGGRGPKTLYARNRRKAR